MVKKNRYLENMMLAYRPGRHDFHGPFSLRRKKYIFMREFHLCNYILFCYMYVYKIIAIAILCQQLNTSYNYVSLIGIN